MSETTISLDNLNSQKYRAAIEKVTLLAEQGNPEAQYRLGLLYASSTQYTPLDYHQASVWIQKAAAQQHVGAQSTLGWLYANGFGVSQDDVEAGRWYLRAAEQGAAKDQYMVGTMFRWGRYGVEKDLTQMLYWYQQSAQQHFANAQYALGKLLMDGQEVQSDNTLAFQWLSLAAANGSEAAEEALNTLMERLPAEQLEQLKQQMLNQTPT